MHFFLRKDAGNERAHSASGKAAVEEPLPGPGPHRGPTAFRAGGALAGLWVGQPWSNAKTPKPDCKYTKAPGAATPYYHHCNVGVDWIDVHFDSATVMAPVQTTVTTVQLSADLKRLLDRRRVVARMRDDGWQITEEAVGESARPWLWTVTAVDSTSEIVCLVRYMLIDRTESSITVSFMEPWIAPLPGGPNIQVFPVGFLSDYNSNWNRNEEGLREIATKFDFDGPVAMRMKNKIPASSAARFDAYIKRVRDIDYLRQLAAELTL
jgi:hypothetical protein